MAPATSNLAAYQWWAQSRARHSYLHTCGSHKVNLPLVTSAQMSRGLNSPVAGTNSLPPLVLELTMAGRNMCPPLVFLAPWQFWPKIPVAGTYFCPPLVTCVGPEVHTRTVWAQQPDPGISYLWRAT